MGGGARMDALTVPLPAALEASSSRLDDVPEPTAADLASITEEWPVIEAESRVVEAEALLAAFPSPLTVRLHRRMVARLSEVTRQAAGASSRVELRRLTAGARSRLLADAPTASVAA